MIVNIIVILFILAFIELLITRAVYEAEDSESSHYLVRLLNVVVVPFLFVFGLLILIKIVSWL